MTTDHPALSHYYLEDSYLVGVTADGRRLRLSVVLALTIDHPLYRAPLPNEQHCYRRGDIVLDAVTILSQRPGKPHVICDPDGTLDFGSIEFWCNDDSYHFVSEWIQLEIRASSVNVELGPETRERG